MLKRSEPKPRRPNLVREERPEGRQANSKEWGGLAHHAIESKRCRGLGEKQVCVIAKRCQRRCYGNQYAPEEIRRKIARLRDGVCECKPSCGLFPAPALWSWQHGERLMVHRPRGSRFQGKGEEEKQLGGLSLFLFAL
jgi:hypothetical protein